MARRLVNFIEGSFYHIYNRGAGKRNIFISNDNYVFVMKKIAAYSTSTSVKVTACCLMPNHYHLLLYQGGAKKAGSMVQYVFNSYAKAFNVMYKRSGTLFEAPFKAKLVDKEEYLTSLCCYIHLNPVSAQLAQRPEQWQYSNYLECVGKRNRFPHDQSFIIDHFGSPSGYEQFVREYAVGKKQSEKFFEYLFDEE